MNFHFKNPIILSKMIYTSMRIVSNFVEIMLVTIRRVHDSEIDHKENLR